MVAFHYRPCIYSGIYVSKMCNRQQLIEGLPEKF